MTPAPAPSTPSPDALGRPLRVVVAGGGVGALETVLALRELAGDRVQVTVIAPEPEYVDRPMTVREPFAGGPARHYALATLVPDMGAALVVDRLDRVDTAARQAHTAGGTVLPYDALVVAIGGRTEPAFPHATTIDDRALDAQLHGLVQDVEGGYVHRIAFVVPERMAWPLPIYELALMTAERAYDMNATTTITIVTPEAAPLAVFGDTASDAVAALLAERGIALVAGTVATVPSSGHVVLGHGRPPLEVDRVIALPDLFGPGVRGLPHGAHGFLPVDSFGGVDGLPAVHAIGDAADYPVKHGGIAAQQGQTVAAVIARAAGADVTPQPLRPTIEAMLMTGGAPLHLSARAAGATGFASGATTSPGWSPATKTAAHHLAPFLRAHDPAVATGRAA